MTDWSIHSPDENLESKDAASRLQNYVDVFNKTFAEDKYAKRLDYTPQSLAYVDKLIKRVWAGGCPSDESMNECIAIFGGYVGRALENTFEGRWWHDGTETIYVTYSKGQCKGFAFHPYNWAIKRLTEGESLMEKFELVAPMAEAFTSAKSQKRT